MQMPAFICVDRRYALLPPSAARAADWTQQRNGSRIGVERSFQSGVEKTDTAASIVEMTGEETKF